MQNFIIALLVCSASMSVLALLYMVCSPLFAKRYSDKWRYYAWLFIILGLIIPFRPQWGNALVNMEVPNSNGLPLVQINGEALNNFLPPPMPIMAVENTITSNTTIDVSLWHVAAAIWLAGVILFVAFQSIRHYRFMKMVRRWSENINDGYVLSLLENLKSEMGISKRIPVFLCPFAIGPMMVGLIKPRILLPSIEMTHDELCFILKHELVHYRRKDLLYKYLLLTAMAIHWFNPVVYLIAKAVSALCEESCDTEVVHNTNADTRLSYSETIIGVVKYQSRLKTALSTNFYGGKKGMKNRISSIMDTRNKKAGMIITGLVLTLVVGTGLVFAATPAQAERGEPFTLSYVDEYERDVTRTWGLGIDEYGNEYEFSGVSVTETFVVSEEEARYLIPLAPTYVDESVDTVQYMFSAVEAGTVASDELPLFWFLSLDEIIDELSQYEQINSRHNEMSREELVFRLHAGRLIAYGRIATPSEGMEAYFDWAKDNYTQWHLRVYNELGAPQWFVDRLADAISSSSPQTHYPDGTLIRNPDGTLG